MDGLCRSLASMHRFRWTSYEFAYIGWAEEGGKGRKLLQAETAEGSSDPLGRFSPLQSSYLGVFDRAA